MEKRALATEGVHVGRGLAGERGTDDQFAWLATPASGQRTGAAAARKAATPLATGPAGYGPAHYGPAGYGPHRCPPDQCRAPGAPAQGATAAPPLASLRESTTEPPPASSQGAPMTPTSPADIPPAMAPNPATAPAPAMKPSPRPLPFPKALPKAMYGRARCEVGQVDRGGATATLADAGKAAITKGEHDPLAWGHEVRSVRCWRGGALLLQGWGVVDVGAATCAHHSKTVESNLLTIVFELWAACSQRCVARRAPRFQLRLWHEDEARSSFRGGGCSQRQGGCDHDAYKCDGVVINRLTLVLVL